MKKSEQHVFKFSGRSMFPFLIDGCTVKIKECKPYKIGDILLLSDSKNKELITHRLISTSPFETKGDNSFVSDNLDSSQVLGRVISFQYKNNNYQYRENSFITKFIVFFSQLPIKNHFPRRVRLIIYYLFKIILLKKVKS